MLTKGNIFTAPFNDAVEMLAFVSMTFFLF